VLFIEQLVQVDQGQVTLSGRQCVRTLNNEGHYIQQ